MCIKGIVRKVLWSINSITYIPEKQLLDIKYINSTGRSMFIIASLWLLPIGSGFYVPQVSCEDILHIFLTAKIQFNECSFLLKFVFFAMVWTFTQFLRCAQMSTQICVGKDRMTLCKNINVICQYQCYHFDKIVHIW